MSLTKEQKEIRSRGIGGSEIAAVLGRSPYATPLAIYLRKVEPQDFPESAPQKRGRLLERAVLDWFSEDSGLPIVSGLPTMVHPERPVVLATPDALVNTASSGVEPAVVEAKTANFRMADQWGEPGTDEVPEQYLMQTQFEMACAGVRLAHVPVLIGGDDFRIYRVAFDEELFGVLADAAERFWRDHVEPRRPPPLDGTEHGDEWLRRRFPRHERTALLPANPLVDELVARLGKLHGWSDRIESERDVLKQRLQELIGTDAGFETALGKVTWKANKDSTRTDWEAAFKLLLREMHGLDPDRHWDVAGRARFAVESATTTKPGARVLRLPFKKSKGLPNE